MSSVQFGPDSRKHAFTCFKGYRKNLSPSGWPLHTSPLERGGDGLSYILLTFLKLSEMSLLTITDLSNKCSIICQNYTLNSRDLLFHSRNSNLFCLYAFIMFLVSCLVEFDFPTITRRTGGIALIMGTWRSHRGYMILPSILMPASTRTWYTHNNGSWKRAGDCF